MGPTVWSCVADELFLAGLTSDSFISISDFEFAYGSFSNGSAYWSKRVLTSPVMDPQLPSRCKKGILE